MVTRGRGWEEGAEEQEACPQEDGSGVFTATVFRAARNWRQPSAPPEESG